MSSDNPASGPEPSPRRGAPGVWQEVGWILGKDLRAERRNPVFGAVPMLLGAGVVALCAVVGGGDGGAELASAAVWVSVAFAGVHAASHAYLREQSSGALRVLLCGPVRGVSLYLGKGLGVLAMTAAGGLTAVALTALLIDASALMAHPGRLFGVLLAGCTGFAVAGALVAPLLGLGGGREPLLALVLLPLGVPVIVSGARATAALAAQPVDLGSYRDALGIVLALDVLFFALALWLFEPLVRRRG